MLLQIILVLSILINSVMLKYPRIMSMKCDYNESYAKIHVCDAKSVKNDIAVLNFQVEFKGLTSPEVMNLTHFVKVKDQYVPFGQSRTPMGPKKFCDIMDGKWGDVGTMAIVAIMQLISPDLVHRCPYKGQITCRNLTLNQRLNQIGRPLGDYILGMAYFDKNWIKIISLDFYFKMVNK